MEAAIAAPATPANPQVAAPLEGDHGDGVGQEVAARGKRQRCDKGLLIVDGDVCPDLGALYEEGEEEAQMEEDQVQDVN